MARVPSCFPVALLELRPETVEALRPPPLCPTLFQRHGARQRSGLLAQHIQVVLQVQPLLLPLEAALMPRHTLSLVPDLDVGSMHFGLDCGCPAAAAPSRSSSAPVTQPLPFTFGNETAARSKPSAGSGRRCSRSIAMRRPDRLLPPGNHPLLSSSLHDGQQQLVELLQVAGLRQRHQVVPAEIARLPLPRRPSRCRARCAELALESAMRPEGDESLRLFSLMSAQNLLHRTLQIVESQDVEDPTKMTGTPTRALPGNACWLACGYARWNEPPLAIDRMQKTYSFCFSPPNSAHASYQST